MLTREQFRFTAEAVFGLLGLITNLVMMTLVIIKKKKQKHVFEYTLVSLCLADIMFSTLNLLQASYKLLQLDFSEFPYWFVLYFSLTSSFLHIFFIAIQRLLAIWFPMKFQRMFSKMRCMIVFLVLWAVSAVLAVLEDQEISGLGIDFIFADGIFVFGVLIMLVYAVICYRLYKPRASIIPTSVRRARSSSNRRIIVHSFVVSMVFISCTFPFAIVKLEHIDGGTHQISHGLLVLNPFLDSLLYFMMNYCKGERNCLKKCFHLSSGSEDTTVASAAVMPTEHPIESYQLNNNYLATAAAENPQRYTTMEVCHTR